MPTLLKKCGGAQKTVGFAGAVIYLLTTFALPLTHTCCLHQSSPSICDFNRPHGSACGQAHAIGDTERSSRRRSPNSGFPSYGQQCAACIHSTTSAAIAIQRGATLSTSHVPASVGSSHSSSLLKQPEWTSSIVSRAPPFTTS